jgi:cytoskeleton protein RodZ
MLKRMFAGQAHGTTTEFKDTHVGRLLCATRMRLGKDLQHIAQVLHIRYTYLVAIEDGRYEDLPGQAYAIGFVRAYADLLELDGEEVIRRYKEESSGLKRKAALDFPIPAPDSGVPSGVAMLGAVALGAGIYALWYGFTGPHLMPSVQEVPARLVAQPPAADAVPTTAQPAERGTASAPAPTAADGPPLAVTPDPLASTAAAPAPVPTAPKDVVELRATADSWIQLRSGEKLVTTRQLKKGESYTLPDQPALNLVTGNAGSIQVLLNGQVMPPLGEPGAVVSGAPLDPDHLRANDRDATDKAGDNGAD